MELKFGKSLSLFTIVLPEIMLSSLVQGLGHFLRASWSLAVST